MNQRLKYIGGVVSDAMRVLSQKHPHIPFDDRPAHPIKIVDWTMESPLIFMAQYRLEEAMADYVEHEALDLAEVKQSYQHYARLHTRQFHGAIEQPLEAK